MKVSRFFLFVGVIFVIALVAYLFTTPRSNDIQFTGIIMGNDYIASPLVAGRLERLLVDEGSSVHAGQLIAEIDPSELQAARDSAAANISTFRARLRQSDQTRTLDDQQTAAALRQAQAAATAAHAQLEEAKTVLALDEVTYKRDEGLFSRGVLSAQERDTSAQAYHGAQDNVKALEDQLRSAEAQVAVAEANRRQVEVQQSEVAATRAQVEQAVAQKDQAQTQLGYTEIYCSRRRHRVGAGGAPGRDGSGRRSYRHDCRYRPSLGAGRCGRNLHRSTHVRAKAAACGCRPETCSTGTVFFKGVEGDFATQRDVSRTKRDIKTFEIKVSIPNVQRRLFEGMTAYVLLPPPPGEQHHWLNF